MNPIAIRLLSQQLVSTQLSDPADVVSHMGAMQAQDYRMMRWAVAMRTRKPSAEAFCKAYDEGRIIRLHLLRGTWQLVSGEDYWWMLDLCSDKAKAVISSWMKQNRVSIPEEEQHRVRDILVQTAGEKGSVTKDGFDEALRQRGITMTTQRLSYHIRFAEIDGTLCSGNLSKMKATYSLAPEKVKPTLKLERDEALTLLARNYFQSHSPATLEDYVWWSGLNISDCRKGINLLGGELHQEKWHGYEFYIHESCRTRGFRKDNALLLPTFDEYLIGYKTRELCISPEHIPHAYTNNGIFFPIVALDGIIKGNWTPWEKEIAVKYFAEDTNSERILEKIEQYKQFKKEHINYIM